MDVYFVRDHKQRYRYFTSEPIEEIQVQFTRLKKLWLAAKKRLMLLPKRTLAQEQAFERTGRPDLPPFRIFHSGCFEPKKIRSKFFFFLQKQRSKHVLFLIGEIIILPISGLMALLPGPNVFFGFLALIMIAHWQALKGLNGLCKKDYTFVSSPLIGEWEDAVSTGKADRFPELLEKMEKKFALEDLAKILWK